MQLKPITAIIVLLLVVASLLVSGCTVITPSTSSPTPTPTTTVAPTVTTPTQTDYSSELTKLYESSNFIMERPFTKSINERGNDVYKGTGRNATLPGAPSVTVVVEFVRSDADAKSVYNQQVDTKGKEGYAFSADGTAYRKAVCKGCGGVWAGTNGNKLFICDWENLWQFDTYAVVTQSWVHA